MTKTRVLLFALVLASALAARAEDHVPGGPDTVVLQSGALKLHALLWHPAGHGPFPAVLFNHGSGNTPENQAAQAAAVGLVFAKHGYVLLFVYRRGSGPSADQGTSAIDLMDREFAAHGWQARNKLQLGASLTLLIAERDSALRAAIAFSGSASSWEHSPQLRARLLAAVGHTTVPIFFIQAENDYSVAPAKALSAEMERLGKPHRVKIYPPVGQTADDGHAFVFLRVGAWEPDVFDFLHERMRR
jgi:carboxymethylenebutenolidase